MYNISLLNKTESAVLRLTHRMYRPIYVSNNIYPRQYRVHIYIYIIYRVEMCYITIYDCSAQFKHAVFTSFSENMGISGSIFSEDFEKLQPIGDICLHKNMMTI